MHACYIIPIHMIKQLNFQVFDDKDLKKIETRHSRTSILPAYMITNIKMLIIILVLLLDKLQQPAPGRG